MANTFCQIHIQVVFAVKYRDAMINDEWKKELYAVIGNLINETGCKTIIINGMSDHVHCLFSLKPTQPISELMKTIKAKSSKWINDKTLTKRKFEWQDGYGAFSYTKSDVKAVIKYIEEQEVHHQKKNFKEEYLHILKNLDISFDERYVFQDLA